MSGKEIVMETIRVLLSTAKKQLAAKIVAVIAAWYASTAVFPSHLVPDWLLLFLQERGDIFMIQIIFFLIAVCFGLFSYCLYLRPKFIYITGTGLYKNVKSGDLICPRCKKDNIISPFTLRNDQNLRCDVCDFSRPIPTQKFKELTKTLNRLGIENFL
jgi:hypothetical protein